MSKQIGADQFGLPLGSPLPKLMFENYDGRTVTLDGDLKYPSLFLIISLDCPLCVDLLPWIEDMIKSLDQAHFVLLSDGSAQENRDMVEYFKWNFPVLSITPIVREALNLTAHPAVFYVTEQKKIGYKSIIKSVNEWLAIPERLRLGIAGERARD